MDIRTRKHKYTVASEFGTFTRTTGRTYIHVVIARNANVPGDAYGVLGWTSRFDLTRKLAAYYRARPALWTDVRVLDVATGKEVAFTL